MEKPKIDYPCEWTYKIIGYEGDVVEKALPSVMGDVSYKFCTSNKSKTGKYTSFNLTVNVESEEKRIEIFNKIKKIPTVITIL
ncbi:MAG: DUF493 domain-containing protein [bacterium]|nr:DUF493 domain-containing protein [bacterium]